MVRGGEGFGKSIYYLQFFSHGIEKIEGMFGSRGAWGR